MKKLLSIPVLLFALLIIGCQENSITDPIQSTLESNKTTTSASGTLELSERLDYPYQVFNTFIDLEGSIDYQLAEYPRDPVPPYPQVAVALQLNVNADLFSVCTVCDPAVNQTSAGVITSQSSDVLTINDGQTYTLVKSFLVQKSEVDMVLKFKLYINSGAVSVAQVWLEATDIPDASDSSQ